MSHGPVTDFVNACKNVSFFHLWFSLFFLVVLFWIGFFSIWVCLSLIFWSINFLSYSIGHLVKGSKSEEGIEEKPVKGLIEINTENEAQGELKKKISPTEQKDVRIPIEKGLKEKEEGISKFKPKGPLLTKKEFTRLLESSGLTITQFAEKLGISRQMVSYIIHGKRNMTRRISEKAKEIFYQSL